MNRSSGKNVTGTLAQWEDFFHACGISHEYNQTYAAKFVKARVRPYKLSTYTKDDYKELDMELGDRKAIQEYLASTNGNPQEFDERKPIVRPHTSGDDDIIWDPAPLPCKQEDHNNSASGAPSVTGCGVPQSAVTCTRTDDRPLSTDATAPLHSRRSEPLPCKQEDNSASDAVAVSASGVPTSAVSGPRAEHPLSADATEPIRSRSTEPLPRKLVDNNASEALAVRASGVPLSAVGRTRRERPLSTDATSPSPLAGSADDSMPILEAHAQQTQCTVADGTTVDHSGAGEENPEDLIVEGALADKGKACDDENGQVSMLMEWEEMGLVPAETPKDEPTDAIPPNAPLTSREVEHLAIAMQEPYPNSAELPTESRSSNVDADQTVRITVHEKVVDTSLAFRHHKPGMKFGLKELASTYLRQNIQQGSEHCSVEDAQTCMKLMRRKVGN